MEAYWKTPIAVRRDDVSAVSCAACHPLQFADWSRSRHAGAMGPGVWAQMRDQPEIAASCARCHAPIDLQPSSPYLSADGVGCSACHVRAHDVFGPPPGPATLLPLVSQFAAPHGRTNVRPFFEQAGFCSPCHQFRRGEAPVVHGTVLQNTNEEWRASRAAKEGRSCQSCHMPDRRHFFRGIHDPDTVRAATRSTFDAQFSGNRVTARLTLTNTGVGHAFPTYVVPQVWMRIELVDDQRAIRAFSERLIARTVAVEAGAWSQAADTRLHQDQTAALTFDGPLPAGVRAVVGRVVVLPDAWHTDSLRGHLRETRSPQAARYYAAALEEIDRSGYTLFRLERAIR